VSYDKRNNIMSSNFEKNSIRLTETPATKVSPPDSSKDIKLFQENGEVKVKDFAGNVKALVQPQQELKVAQVAVNTNEDATQYILRIPSPNAKLIALERQLLEIVAATKGELKLSITEAVATIASLKNSQELADGIFDSNLKEIEQKISEIETLVNTKVSSSDFTALQTQLAQFVQNINTSLSSRATKVELDTLKATIPAPIGIVAKSDNVKVTKEGNTFGIAVDVPEITREVTREIQQVGGGGVSKKFVMDYVDSAVENISGSGTVTDITSSDGSILVTPIAGGYNLAVISGGASNLSDLNDVILSDIQNGQTIKYLNGNWVNSPDITGAATATWGAIVGDIANQSDLQVALGNLTPLTTTASISGDLQGQIDAIMQEGTSIASSGGSILVTQNGLDYNIEVASAPIQNHNSLLELQGDGVDYFHLNASQFASISGGIDLSAYTLISTTASVSASLAQDIANLDLDLQSQISAITVPTSATFLSDYDARYVNESDLTGTLGNYTLLSTTTSISGDFEVRINSLEVTKEDTNEPNGFINRTDSTLYYDATTATFAISGNYAVYLDGNKFLKTGDSATLTPAYGTQYIYYVYNTGDFTVSPTLFNVAKDAPIAYAFFNDGATDSFLAEERHGITMDGVTHQYLHRTVGSKYVSGMMLGDYILNSDTVANNKYSISEGTFYDEDILNEIPALPDNGPYNIFYRTGASGNWTWSKTQAYPYLINANSIRYNQFTGGSWQLTDITNITTSNRWVNYYVFATNAITPGFEYIIIPGQAIYTSLTLAKGESVANLSLGNLPFAEIVPVARVTHQFSTGYATANGRARIVAVASLTATSFVSAIATASNHNSLSGLQGGVAGEYYHLTSTEYDDLIGSTEVASISGDLQSQISGITIPTSATFLSDYDNRYVNISGDTMTGRLLVSDTTEATTLSDGSIQTDGGMSVTKTVVATDYKLSNGNSLTRHEDNLFVEAPTNKTYTVVAKANIPRTLTSINGLKTLVGTCTVAIHINGTPVTFTGSVTTISVTSTPQDVAIISGGTVASDARITCVITSVAGASDIEFTLAGTRT